MDSTIWLSTLATLLIALIGFGAKYLNDKKVAQQKGRLDRVNQQLRLLYGPLYATDQAARTVWIQFRKKYRPAQKSYCGSSPPPTKEEAEAGDSG